MRRYKGFFKRFIKMMAPVFYSKYKKELQKCSAYMLLLIILQMVLAVIVTSWTAGTFNAIEAHSIMKLIEQILALAALFVGSVAINSEHCRIRRTLQITIREWLSENAIKKWITDGAHLELLKNPNNLNDNPDGRISSDIRCIADGSIDLLNGLVYNILMLIGFVPVLWELSGVVVVGGIAIHGYLVWLAIIYAATASIFGYKASLPLTQATNDMNTAEADLRFALTETKKNSGKIVLQKLSGQEYERLVSFIDSLKDKFFVQTKAWLNVTKFNVAYGTLNIAAPIIAAAPRYITGFISMGGLIQAAQSFSHLVNALSWPVYAMPSISIWRASVERVLNLVDSIDSLA